MLTSTLLVKKRDGHELTDAEIRFLVNGFCSGEVADYQMSALAMAICLRGMSERETATLTQAMWESGQTLPRPEGDDGARLRVDKHSTGGLGDKVSLILAPLLAACEMDVPMVSGRGLGLTGGTLDKLEAIDGLQTQLTTEHANAVLRQAGAFIVGASEQIAPADRKLYALRDVTGTVESIPLITASILSKKLAANLDVLVMDVKVGSAAFMKTEAQAIELARSLVAVGRRAGLPTIAMLTDMDQPLGRAVGNAIEVNEAVEVLQGDDGVVRELTIELCAELLVAGGRAETLAQARGRLATAIDSGAAMERFERMIRGQGGKTLWPLKLAHPTPLVAERDGVLAHFDCAAIGTALVEMGAGRRKTGQAIDHRVGLQVHARIGDSIVKGQPILTIHYHAKDTSRYANKLRSAIHVQPDPVPQRALVLKRIGRDD